MSIFTTNYSGPKTSAQARRETMSSSQLWQEERSLALAPMADLIRGFDTFLKQRFNLTHPEISLYYPEEKDMLIGETYGVFAVSDFDDDPGFSSDSDAFKMIRAGVVLAKGCKSKVDAEISKACMAIDIDDSIPRFKFFAENGYGMFHESLVLDQITFRQNTYLNTDDIPVFVVAASFTVAFRLVIRKDMHHLHEDLPHDFGVTNSYQFNVNQYTTTQHPCPPL